MFTKKPGLLGIGLKSTDYSISLSNKQVVPKSEQNFVHNGITFNQGSSMACTIFSAFTLIANKFNLEFITSDWILDKWYNDAVLHYGASAKNGWYVSSGVDYVRNWFNSQSDLVEKYGKLSTGFLKLPYSWEIERDENAKKTVKLFEELLRNNHDCCGGHNGSRDYNVDFQSDGVLNLKKLSNPTYGHAICMSADIQGEFDMNSDLLVANSWKGVNNNVYRLEHIQDLIDNNVLFPTVYFFFSEKDQIVFSGKDYVADTNNDLVKRFNNSYVMLAESTGAIYDVRGDKLISVDKFFRTKEDREKLIKTYEPLKLLTGISDDNFYTMVK
ncbi:MAG: hypothetical protein K9L99_05840 [Candidatus Omnitrophica bacterium]|nr:hypothetical protein [Candidatus Omnitrophota bacterium]